MQTDRTAYKAAYRAANRVALAAKQRAYVQRNREAVHEKKAAYREVNRPALAAKSRTYFAANRERILKRGQETAVRERHIEASREWRTANQDYRLAYAATARVANRAAILIRQAAWRERSKEHRAAYAKDNADRGAEYFAHRRALKLQATPVWLTPEQRKQIAGWYRLARATGREVDHAVPLAGKNVCGLHVPWNLQLLTPFENRSKGNRHATELC